MGDAEQQSSVEYLAVCEGGSIEECKAQMYAILDSLPANALADQRAPVRPKITKTALFLGFLLPIALLAAGLVLINIYVTVARLRIAFNIALPVLYVLLRTKYNLLFLIRLYQRFASDDLRMACCYEPSCSEYMTLAIKKYGLLRGVVRGIKRLRRCGKTEGGVDYP